jgi:hypothetical protein
MANSRKLGLSFGAALLICGTLLLYRNRRLFLVNDVTTGQSFDYPDLRTHIYIADINAVGIAAEQSIQSLSKWRLVFHDRDRHVLMAEVEGPIGGYLSEITVTLSNLGTRYVRTVIQSCSSSGRGDLGENAKYIRQLQNAMDRLLLS